MHFLHLCVFLKNAKFKDGKLIVGLPNNNISKIGQILLDFYPQNPCATRTLYKGAFNGEVLA